MASIGQGYLRPLRLAPCLKTKIFPRPRWADVHQPKLRLHASLIICRSLELREIPMTLVLHSLPEMWGRGVRLQKPGGLKFRLSKKTN